MEEAEEEEEVGACFECQSNASWIIPIIFLLPCKLSSLMEPLINPPQLPKSKRSQNHKRRIS